MLFKSNAGKKGLRSLFQAYDPNCGSTANALAKEQGYRIGRRKIPLLSGECKCDEKVIVVSRSKPAVAEEFTIFHELAHHFLDGLAPVFGEQKYLPVDIADDIEYWCDHFALAMFFAQRGARLMGKSNYREFLTHGNAAAYDHRDSISPWRQSKVLSRRVPPLARKHFKLKRAAHRDCMMLSRAFVRCSKSIRREEDF